MAMRPLLRALALGVALRCPACEEGKLFHRFATWRARCTHCGRDFDAGGEFTGAMMIAQFVFAGIAIYGWWLLTLTTGLSLAGQVAWVVGVGVVLPLLTYRHVKGLWIGILVAHEVLEPAGRPG